MSNQNQRFNFKTTKIISIAIAGVALMLLGRFIVQSLASTLWLNNAINGDAFVAVLNSELALSLVLRGVGVGLFLFSMYRAYVNRQSFTFRAFKKTLVLSSLLCLVVIMSSTVVEAPLTAADKMNTIAQGYKICISDGYYDYWIGQLSNDQYFAIRGSDGNAMTFVEPWQLSPPWAAYASNYTALEQQVLAAITSGTVYSKEVPFDYNLTIPSNVRFIENVNGLERNFVSSANSQGSPYTISQDTVNSGYYLAQDSAGRYLDQWSSTDATTVLQNTVNLNNVAILVKAGTYPVGLVNATGKTNITISGENLATILTLKPNTNLMMFECQNTIGFTFQNLYFDGNAANQVGSEDTLIEVGQAQHFQFLNNYAINTWGDVVTGPNAKDVLIQGNYAENCKEDSFHADGGSYWKIVDNHVVNGSGLINLYCATGRETTDTTVSGNTLININGTSAVRFGGGGNQRRIVVSDNMIINPVVTGIALDEAGLHEDITIAGNTFIGGVRGIWLAQTGTGTYQNININNNIFKNQSLQGIMVEVNCKNLQVTNNIINSTIDIGAKIVSNVNFVGNTISNCQSYGLRIQNATGGIIANNIIQYCNTSGIFLYGTTNKPVKDFVISNNILKDNRQVGTGTHGGILINDDGNTGAACSNIIINGNNIFDDQGTPTQAYGIIESSNSFNNVISNNLFYNNGILSISKISTSNVTILNNKGYNPLQTIANPFSANLSWIVDSGNNATITSERVYTNLQSPKTIYVSGGTVTTITVNGQITGLTTGTFRLEPFDTFAIAFSSAPTLIVMGQ